MFIYLLKMTIIWSLLLLTYELLFKSGGQYSANRLFLLFSLITGIVLPLVPTPWQTTSLNVINDVPVVFSNAAVTDSPSLQIPNVAEASASWSIQSVLLTIYVAVAAVLFIICIAEVAKILRSAIYGKYTSSSGYRIFESNKPHAPFSFMGWIFITNIKSFKQTELDFVLAHEAAHNLRKHWIDVLVMQLLCILFWFHPLVWRYRYLLKMQHEYEADNIAATCREYEYGHFLLQQTLLKNTPSIAHSFHYSPIKNRITMLTKNSKTNNWKYLAVLPVLAFCTMAMDSQNGGYERKTVGQLTTFKNNEFKWMNRPDKDVIMGVWGSDERYVGKHAQRPIIVRMNNDSVYDNESRHIIPAQYRVNNEQYYEALNKKFRDMVTPLPDSIDDVNVMNIVVDQKGKIVYYDLEYHCKSSGHSSIPYWDKKIGDVISSLPDWLPALKDGKPVPSFQEIAGAIRINETPRTFTIKPLSREETEKMSKEKPKK